MKNENNSKSTILQIRQAIEAANKIGIVAHIRPDGDAVGSMLGLGLALITAGKNVQMVLRDGVSKTFRHLPGSDLIKKAFEDPCDLYIVLDSSDLPRTGAVLPDRQFDICIDHHITNDRFARINYVDADAVATAAILAELIPQLGFEIDKPVASALLTGILSDTIGFRTSNMNEGALRIAAALVEKGADIHSLYNKALITRPFDAAKYWGFALSRLQRKDGVVWTTLTLEDRVNSGYKHDDDADLTNLLSAIEESRVSVLFVEQNATHTKVSWRSIPGVDVSVLASEFNGGGHAAAAGADCPGTLAEVEEKVLVRTMAYLRSIENGTFRGEINKKDGER
jgi:phosphoesterase RecJ-like protein